MLTARQLLPFTLSIALAGCAGEGTKSDSQQSSTRAESAGTAADAIAPLSEQEAALQAAAVKGDTDTVKAMLDKGAKVDARDENGGTALGHAVWFGHLDTVRLLIDRGADVNAGKRDGSTPLQLANSSNHPEIAEVLKKAGAR
jgi:ankyrin repeat protein